MVGIIEKINTIYGKIDVIDLANENFKKEIIDVLLELKDLQLGLVASDLDKGTFKGNRKTDINLALNMVGITKEKLKDNPDEAESIWTDSTKTVFYDKATALFKDGEVIEIPFVFDGNPTTISTHSDLLLQLDNSDAFKTKLENTLMAAFPALVVGEFVRFYDVTGQSSNLERITLNAVSGAYIEQNPDYYWALTTSATETLSMRGGDIDKIGNEIDNILALVNRIEEVIDIQGELPKLIDTYDENGNPNGDLTIYNKLTKLIEIHAQLTAIVTVYNDIKAGGNNHINSVGADLQLGVNSEIKKVNANKDNIDIVADSTYKAKVETVADSTYKAKVETVADSTYKARIETVADATYKAKVVSVADNMNDINNAEENANLAVQAKDVAVQKANQIIAINGQQTVNTLQAGANATVYYDAVSGKFILNIPQGSTGPRGEAFQVNSVGTLANRALYDTQLANFSYLATDVQVDGKTVPHIYFKKSATSGDWSDGSPFGKGDTGDTGVGITSVTFVGTTDVSGLQAKSGATDTYRILFDNGNTTDFPIYNGLDSAVLTVAGKTGDVTLEIADIIGLSTFVSNVTAIMTSDDTTLDEIQELVNYIKQNRSDLDALGISNIAGLVDALDSIQTQLDSKSSISHNHSGVYLENLKETVYTLTGTALVFANGSIQVKNLTANTTLTDGLTTGEYLMLIIKAGDTYTLTFPTTLWNDDLTAIAPTLSATIDTTIIFVKTATELRGYYKA